MNFKNLIAIVLLAAIIGCTDDSIYDAYKTFDDATWHADSIATFHVEIPDTAKPCDFYINVRNTTDYPYSNLYLFLETHFPDETMARDTIELLLARPSGEWLGTGIGHIRENEFLIRRGLFFPAEGRYGFTLQQGMRQIALKGISDIGIRIEITSR